MLGLGSRSGFEWRFFDTSQKQEVPAWEKRDERYAYAWKIVTSFGVFNVDKGKVIVGYSPRCK
jgi:hypothetical protein